MKKSFDKIFIAQDIFEYHSLQIASCVLKHYRNIIRLYEESQCVIFCSKPKNSGRFLLVVLLTSFEVMLTCHSALLEFPSRRCHISVQIMFLYMFTSARTQQTLHRASSIIFKIRICTTFRSEFVPRLDQNLFHA